MPQKHLAIIEAQECIGCTKCLDVCPTDAILGAERLMHTVITSDCIGCQLCVPVCPVDCIQLVTPEESYIALDKEAIKSRVARHKQRLTKQENTVIAITNNEDERKNYLNAALKRMSEKKAAVK